MSAIRKLINDIDSTHKGLGKLTAISLIAVKAKKFVLLVSPSGCGKSTVMNYIASNIPNSYQPSSISIASLQNKVDRLTSFRSVIVVDDIAIIQTEYARSATVTALSQLVYGHRVEPSMHGFDFVIEDFYGSSLIGIQPVLLKSLMLSPEWDASIQDKALRYYHLQRPLEPDLHPINIKCPKGIEIDKVSCIEPETHPLWEKLTDIGMIQWSRARTKEHLIDFLLAISALENRENVIDADFQLLLELLKPMAIEQVAITKKQLEGERELDNNLLALLTEYYTYGGKFSLVQVSVDYKLTIHHCYSIMKSQSLYWNQITKSPTVYVPSKLLLNLLQANGLDLIVKEKLF